MKSVKNIVTHTVHEKTNGILIPTITEWTWRQTWDSSLYDIIIQVRIRVREKCIFNIPEIDGYYIK